MVQPCPKENTAPLKLQLEDSGAEEGREKKMSKELTLECKEPQRKEG